MNFLEYKIFKTFINKLIFVNLSMNIYISLKLPKRTVLKK